MLTYREALNKVLKEVPGTKAVSCLDYGKFYAFNLIPVEIADPSSYNAGTWLYYVIKSNGLIGMFDFTADWAAYNKAKEISI